MEVVKRRQKRECWRSDKEDGDLIREHEATREEPFLSGWLREGVEGKAEHKEKVNREAKAG